MKEIAVRIMYRGLISLFVSREMYREGYLLHKISVKLGIDEFKTFHETLFHETREGLGEEFAENGRFWRLIKRNDLGNRKRVAVLDAHGCMVNDEWVYFDGRSKHPVQDWIDRHDGKYACLIILCCNPAGATPHIRRSLLVIADRDVRRPGCYEEEPCKFTLIHPKEGEIDTYTIDYYLTHSLRPI